MRLKRCTSWLRERDISTDSSVYEHVVLSLAEVHLKLCQLVKTNNQLCVFKSLVLLFMLLCFYPCSILSVLYCIVLY